MRAKIDVSEVEEATKIRAKYLRALENEEWDLLPGSTFVKSFLRTYAEYLGLDVTLLLEEYKRQFERPSDLDQQPIAPLDVRSRKKPRRHQRPPRSRWWVIALIVVLLLALFAFIGSRNDDRDDPAPTEQTTTAIESKRPSAADRRRAERARERRARVRRRRAAARREVRLRIDPTNTVNVCLVDASGKVLIPGEDLVEGDARGPFTSKSFRVTFGNGSVELVANGKRVRVPDTADPVGYSISPRRQRLLAPADLPTCQ